MTEKQIIGDVCGNCRFYISYQEVRGIGECHRNAPQPAVVYTDEMNEWSWPDVGETDFCGEFQEKT